MNYEINPLALQPNSIYAVQYTIDTRKYPNRKGKQRGIICTNAIGAVYLTYNVNAIDSWHQLTKPGAPMAKHHIYEANQMERDFVAAYREAEGNKAKLNNAIDQLTKARAELRIIKENRWHRFINRIAKSW